MSSAAGLEDWLEIEVADAVATIVMDRPDRRNALSPARLAALDVAVEALDGRRDVAVIVLTGADPCFCAGFDLAEIASEPAARRAARLARPVAHLGAFPPHDVPIIGAVNGPAVTGGLELALGCDFLVASERARFGDTHARVGAMPGMGLVARLPRLVGEARARQLSLTGDLIDAAMALSWGLVNEVVPHEALMARALELAGHVASIPAEVVAELRRMYDRIGGLVGDEALEVESSWSRRWMAARFDADRLAGERAAIIERGRASP